MSDSCNPIDCSPPGSSVHGVLPARMLEWVACPPPGDIPNPGIKPRSPALQLDSLPAEPQGKPENTGVSSLSLLQHIFPTQGLNPGLLHCSWILHQLRHKGSPKQRENESHKGGHSSRNIDPDPLMEVTLALENGSRKEFVWYPGDLSECLSTLFLSFGGK